MFDPQRLFAEFIGTALLVFIGAGSVPAILLLESGSKAPFSGADLGFISMAFGLVVVALVYTVGKVSGCHINPAVTFGLAATKRFPWREVPLYWGAQLVGALLAAALLRASLGDLAHAGATLPSGSQSQAFLWELVLTFFLMLVIMAVATDSRAVGEAAAIAIGGTVGLDALFGGPITGASMNPARSIRPGIVSGDLHALCLYTLAPAVGAALAGLTYQFLRDERIRSAGLAESPERAE